jgi:LDH2 family malate/lactate/ureidoglycolate dehydrogenase
MYFTRQAARSGCIGILTTNASPAMAPWGGREKLIGTNPWSIAAPAGQYPVMLLDIANTAVARGKLYLARQQGEPIPLGWAIDSDGNPTTDPVAGIAGNILPLAGHKGYGIATMMDVLSGILSGSSFADKVVGPYMSEGDSGVGHLALALDISAFRPLSEFKTDMEELIARLKATPRTADTEEIFYPGELEARADQHHRTQGISLPEDTLLQLNVSAEKLGVAGLD